jgi:multicomponent Na+:H+ antiporter subunit G
MTALLAAALILLGSALALIAAVGLFRLPEVYGRMHAATKPAVLGLVLLLAGTAVQLADWSASARLLLAAGLQLVTAPVAMHVVGRAVGRVVGVRHEDAPTTRP